MTIAQLVDELDLMVQLDDKTPVIVWGAPGIGKTAAIRQVTTKHGLRLIDERWGQKTPTDLRLPVPDHARKVMIHYPMSTFPTEGKGVYFLDEYAQATSVMQGIGQQIIDRHLGEHRMGDGWFVWAASNRKEHKAAVHEMPLPTSNRFLHFNIEADVESLEYWWFAMQKDPKFIACLKTLPHLLHKMPTDMSMNAWPSPRSWDVAERRYSTKRSIAPAVGDAAESEFTAWLTTVDSLPNTEQIAAGKGDKAKFSEEPSVKFAIISALTSHSLKSFEKFYNCFKWLLSAASPEWQSLLVLDVLRILGKNNPAANQQYMRELIKLPEAKVFINAYVELATGK